MKKTFFFIAKVAILAIIIIFAFIAYSDYYIHNTQPGYYQAKYSITIKNISFYSPNGFITDIIVPVPRLNGEDVFSDEDLQGITFGHWKSVLVESEDGKMLALQSIGENLSDISATFETDHRQIGEKRWNAKTLSLTPGTGWISDIKGSQISWIESNNPHSTTMVLIPENLPPLSENAPPITVALEYLVLGDRTGMYTIDDYRLQGHCEVPLNFSGKIPLELHSYSRKSIPTDGDMTWIVTVSDPTGEP